MKGNSFYSRKLHSLLGVIPIGFFLIEHFITNFESIHGNDAFIDQVHWLHSLPFIFFLELFGIWLPILYHGVYGMYIAFQSKNNVQRYNYHRNFMFTAQRITGVATFAFIIWHTWQTRIAVALGDVVVDDLGKLMHDILTNPLYFTLYLIGVVAAVFHFSNGMWSFLVSWGITVGPRAQKVSAYIWTVAFFVIALVAIIGMVGFTNPDFFTKGA